MVRKREVRSLVNGLLASFINTGQIDPSGKSPAELHEELRRIADKLPDNFDVVIDYTPDLLAQARRYRRDEMYGFSVLMYATWIEHNVNMILIDLAKAAEVEERYILEMIKRATSQDKTTWLLGLLGGKPFSVVALKHMKKLNDARNAFVHYKWKQLSRSEEKAQIDALTDAESLVRIMHRFKRQELGVLSSRSKAVRREATSSKAEHKERE